MGQREGGGGAEREREREIFLKMKLSSTLSSMISYWEIEYDKIDRFKSALASVTYNL